MPEKIRWFCTLFDNSLLCQFTIWEFLLRILIFGPKIYLILYPSLENSITHITWEACYGCPGAEISAWVFWGVRPNSWTRPRCPPTWRWRLTTFLVGCGGQTHGCAEAHGRGLAVWPGPNISQCVWKIKDFLILEHTWTFSVIFVS